MPRKGGSHHSRSPGGGASEPKPEGPGSPGDPQSVERAIVQLALDSPWQGARQAVKTAAGRGLAVTVSTVRGVWRRRGLQNAGQRLSASERSGETQQDRHPGPQPQALGEAPAETSVETGAACTCPGELLLCSVQYLGKLAFTGPVYEHLIIDSYSRVAFVRLADDKSLRHSVSLLVESVLPFCQQQQVPILRLAHTSMVSALSDDAAAFAAELDRLNISQVQTRTRDVRSGDPVGAYQRLARAEFFSRAMERTDYHTIKELDRDLQGWLARYNGERREPAADCQGRTPVRTFLETAHLSRRTLAQRAPAGDRVIEAAPLRACLPPAAECTTESAPPANRIETRAGSSLRPCFFQGRDPSPWLAGYVALLPFQIHWADHLNIALSDFCLAAYCVFGFSRLRSVRAAWSVWHAAVLGAMAVSLYPVLRSGGTLSRYVQWNKFAGILLLFSLYLAITSEVDNWTGLLKLMRCYFVAVSLQNLVAEGALLTTFLTGRTFEGINYGNERLSGFLLDPNAYGGLLATALLFSLLTSSGEAPLVRGVKGLFLEVSLVVGMLLTFSRGAWLALAAGAVFAVLADRRAAPRLMAWSALGLSVLAALAATGIISLGRLVTRSVTLENRIELNAKAIDAFLEHPFTGLGLGGIREATGVVVHNTVLWFLADMGGVALLALLGFLAWFFLRGAAALRMAGLEARGPVAALLSAHVAMSMMSMSIEAFYQRHWWLVLGLLGAGYAISRSNVARSPDEGGDRAGASAWTRKRADPVLET